MDSNKPFVLCRTVMYSLATTQSHISTADKTHILTVRHTIAMLTESVQSVLSPTWSQEQQHVQSLIAHIVAKAAYASTGSLVLSAGLAASGMVVYWPRMLRNSLPSMVSRSCSSSTILSIASRLFLHRTAGPQ